MRSTLGHELHRTFTETARRKQIVDCAIEVVAELGYAKASVRKIADRVGVAMSVVLYHFTNKDELVGAIVTEIYRSAITAILPAVQAEETAAGKLRAYIRANAAFIDTHRAHHVALLDIGSSFRSATGRRLDEMDVDAQLGDELAALDIESILRLGKEKGEFRPLPERAIAVAVRGALNSAVLEASHDPGFDLVGYGDELADVFDLATRRSV